MNVVELRQYAMVPGRRDDLIEIFEREFVESQEALGMRVLGTFRDLDNPDRFVWLRGFDDMSSRLTGLTDFYGGPAWKANRDAANATMDDVSNVLLLRPVRPIPQMPPRPAVGHTELPGGMITLTIQYARLPYSDETVNELDHRGAGSAIASFRTEYAANDFPALPVRAGEHAFVSIHRGAGRVLLESAPAEVIRTEVLRLSPTARSLLR
jgi:hypothetical protein